MPHETPNTPLWKHEPDEHDYPAAGAYLGLLADPADVDRIVAALQSAPVQVQKAKDILRASRLALLDEHDPRVTGDLDKIRQGHPLSPVLLVRGDLLRGVPTQIADGYHRVCASYHVDENTDIPCRLVDAAAEGDRLP